MRGVGVRPQLTTKFWVSAYLARLGLAAIPAYLTVRGDADAGAVLVKLTTLDGQAVAYQRSFDLTADQRVWVVLAAGNEAAVDAAIARQRGFDRDLWVIEVEDKAGRTLLDEDGLR